MYKYKLTLAYDGTNFCGWQVQPSGVSIQYLIQEALGILFKKPTSLTGSGRTDAGVHALGQVAHCTADHTVDLVKLRFSLNGLLPKEIRVLHIELVPDTFHARYSALSKIYRYHLHTDQVMLPFKRLYSVQVHHPLDINQLKEASLAFIGTHDFTTFANEPSKGSAAKNPVRTIMRIDITQELGGLYVEFEGTGFLYKMVRNIIGTLLDVCSGKLAIEDIPKLFEAKDRRIAGQAAPARGLFLVKVNYPDF